MHVIPGSAGGLTGVGSQYWSQNSAGIVDAAENSDGFGASLATGPIDNVPGEDLAVGVPGEDVGAIVDGGVVHVLYGVAAGLSAAGSQQWSQNSAGIADAVEVRDRFGSAVAIGRLDGNAFAELVVGVPGESIGALLGAGVVQVLPGTAGGSTAAGSQYWSQNSAGIVDASETNDGFGASLATGSIDNVAGADLAIGVPGEDVGALVDGGVVHVLYGAAAGLSAAGSQQWSQNSAGIADAVEAGDRFGSAVALGRINADPSADLVVGVPNESIGATAGAGALHFIGGSAGGLVSAGSQYWSQDSAGIVDSAETGDGFASSLTA